MLNVYYEKWQIYTEEEFSLTLHLAVTQLQHLLSIGQSCQPVD